MVRIEYIRHLKFLTGAFFGSFFFEAFCNCCHFHVSVSIFIIFMSDDSLYAFFRTNSKVKHVMSVHPKWQNKPSRPSTMQNISNKKYTISIFSPWLRRQNPITSDPKTIIASPVLLWLPSSPHYLWWSYQFFRSDSFLGKTESFLCNFCSSRASMMEPAKIGCIPWWVAFHFTSTM